MRNNQPITGQEKQYPNDTILLSTTDLKGNIKYANQDFCSISEFELNTLKANPIIPYVTLTCLQPLLLHYGSESAPAKAGSVWSKTVLNPATTMGLMPMFLP